MSKKLRNMKQNHNIQAQIYQAIIFKHEFLVLKLEDSSENLIWSCLFITSFAVIRMQFAFENMRETIIRSENSIEEPRQRLKHANVLAANSLLPPFHALVEPKQRLIYCSPLSEAAHHFVSLRISSPLLGGELRRHLFFQCQIQFNTRTASNPIFKRDDVHVITETAIACVNGYFICNMKFKQFQYLSQHIKVNDQ